MTTAGFRLKKHATFTKQFFTRQSRIGREALTAVAAACLCGVGSVGVDAATVTVNGNRTLTPQQWNGFVDQAGNGGEIRFRAGLITVTGPLNVDRPLTISGAGSSGTGTRIRIQGNQGALFRVQASNIRIRDLNLGGVDQPFFGSNLFDSTGRIEEGVRALRGLETAVLNESDRFVNLRVLRCRFTNVNVGVEMRRGAMPDGLIVRDCDFTVTRAMILANGANVPGGRLNRPFRIENCRMVNRSRQLRNNNRPLTIRGIVFDFGNNNAGTNVNAIDMNGSVIRNCRFLRVSNWQIGMTQASNVIIENNVLPGGGVQRDSFIHCLHFEDVGNVSLPIVIRNNVMTQNTASGGASHVWTGGNNASGATALRIAGNTYRGISDSLVLVKRPVNQAPLNVRFAHTVGRDVPVSQRARRR